MTPLYRQMATIGSPPNQMKLTRDICQKVVHANAYFENALAERSAENCAQMDVSCKKSKWRRKFKAIPRISPEASSWFDNALLQLGAKLKARWPDYDFGYEQGKL